MSMKEVLRLAADAVINRDEALAKEMAERTLAESLDALEVITHGFCAGITQVGNLFEQGDVFLPDLILASQAMEAAVETLKSSLPKEHQQDKGVIVMGTVEGDIHDIGKGIVISLLAANGFRVYDIGRDVPTQKFIEKAQEVDADIIGTSCLLTTTMNCQKELEDELRKAGMRERFKTMVGGAPVTQRWANKIGADAYAEDAVEAVNKALQLMGKA